MCLNYAYQLRGTMFDSMQIIFLAMQFVLFLLS